MVHRYTVGWRSRHEELSDLHDALLPRYDACEAELRAVAATKRAHAAKLGTGPKKPISLAAELDLEAQRLAHERDALERRLFVAFREVEQVFSETPASSIYRDGCTRSAREALDRELQRLRSL